MVRSYLRHEPTNAYGLICSPSGQCCLKSDGKTAVVPALEDVLVWDVKTGEQRSMWHDVGHTSRVTALAHSPLHANSSQVEEEEDLWAVGYADGSIRIWNARSSSVKLTLNGHKSAITVLSFDRSGLVLASGSQDTNITLWDIVAESGMFRLRGHRDAVTDLTFVYGSSHEQPSTSARTGSTRTYILSTSKDGLLKLWDISLQHCIETILVGKSELWSLAVLQGRDIQKPNPVDQIGALILVGDSEGKVKIYQVASSTLSEGLESLHKRADNDSGSGPVAKMMIEQGQINLTDGRRVMQIDFGPTTSTQEKFLAISCSDRNVEIFRIRSEEDIKKKMTRRRRRAKEKSSQKEANEDEVQEVTEVQPTWKDRIEPYTIVRPTKGKLKSFAFSEKSITESARSSIPMLLAMGNNALEIHHIPLPKKNKGNVKEQVGPSLSSILDLAGHRSEARALGLSFDDSLLASADGAGSLKIWNTRTGRVVRTLPCGYALALAWLPDNYHVLVGCKDGTLKTYDIRAGSLLEDIQAHEGPIWSVVIHPDGQSCLTASGDKDVKFWEFEAKKVEDRAEEDSNAEESVADDEHQSISRSQLSLTHVRTLKMTDDILCARYSPDGRLLALSLLDSTVKIFFADSLKFFLSLYGHKLPVLSLDISGDNKLCVTVSADKNAKLWGLDFGDCHRSLFAHEESVVGVAFEKGEQGGGLMGGRQGASHHFWTCAKDGKLKYWDGDRFQCIQTLTGHHGDVSALAVGAKGTMLVSSGADRSIRIWEKTEEPLFLEEERERELEEMYERDPAQQHRRDDELAIGSLPEGTEGPSSDVKEVEQVTNTSKDTLMAGERLLEAIELAGADLAAHEEHTRQQRTSTMTLAPPASNPIIAHAFEPGEDVSPHAYVLKVVSKILPMHLDDALLVLPFDAVVRLMTHLDYWARKEWNISLVSRILFFLLRNYHGQIVSNRIMRNNLISVRSHLRASLQRQKMTIGFNLAGLQFVKARLVEQKTGEMVMRDGLDIDDDVITKRLEHNFIRKRKMIA